MVKVQLAMFCFCSVFNNHFIIKVSCQFLDGGQHCPPKPSDHWCCNQNSCGLPMRYSPRDWVCWYFPIAGAGESRVIRTPLRSLITPSCSYSPPYGTTQLHVVSRGASVYRGWNIAWRDTQSTQLWEVIIHAGKRLSSAAAILGKLILQ